MKRSPLVVAGACVAALALLLTARAGGAEEVSYAAHLKAKSPAVVSLRCNLKVRIAFNGRNIEMDRRVETCGTVVDPSGLVLVSNLNLGGDSGGVIRRLLSRAPGASFSADPVDLKVTVEGGEEKELDAVLVARDSVLGLAFVQVLDLKDRRLASVDLSVGAKAPAPSPEVRVRPGQTLFGVTRHSRAWDQAPLLAFLYPSRRVEKPRPMWGLSGEFNEMGMPIFDSSGAPVGVLVAQGGAEDGEEDGGFSMGSLGAFLLPLDAVVRSLEAAKKRVPEAIAKAAEKPEGAAMDGAAMDDAAMDDAPMDGGMPEEPPGNVPPK